MMDLSTPQTLKSLKNPRKSEVMAWGFAILLIMMLIFIPSSGVIRIGAIIFAVFFLISGLFMSIGNWMGRVAELRLSEEGIGYFNGLQEVHFGWGDVERVEVYAGRFNDKISLVSAENRMSFDLSIDKVDNGKPSGQIGFQDGELILETILIKSGLIQKEKQLAQGYYYYSKD
jgi:hypothetical protein